MILYIAEKPSLARAVADVLPRPHKKGDGFIEVGNGDIVSWCIGHLLEQAQPEAYHADYKKWQVAHLPIVPETWKLEVKPKTRKQFTTLKKLIKQATVLVNIGDPDREGQILVDEVIHHCKVSKTKINGTQRCLINDLNPQAVKKSLHNLRSNSEFIPLATSALARARADWLYGINMTRLCTLQGQKSGFSGVLSIGRVQTPLLGLVVRRDLEIEQFTSKPFYELTITLNTSQPFSFNAKWQPSDACLPYMDDENRVLSRKLVENVASRVINQQGQVSHFSAKDKNQAPPLPYNLSSLQIDAAKRFGMSAKRVLDTCQNLYERHKLITYPRSDCRYLPSEHFLEATTVIAAIHSSAPKLHEIISHTNIQLKSKAWNDKQVSAHHAIIPTSKKANNTSLSSDESAIYDIIARQYLMQFLPAFSFKQIIIESTVAGGIFISKRKEIQDLGWKLALPLSKQRKDGAEKDNDFVEGKTPTLKKGDALTCTDTNIHDKQTTPPKRFNDASLLSAMTGIARYVQDPEIRKVLRETDGLGTEATRAGIIELLFTRNYLSRKGKDILSTDIARQLILNLPECVSLPDMTAQWEAQLESISNKALNYQQFMSPMITTLNALVQDVSNVSFDGLKGKGKPFKPRTRKRSKTK